LCYAGPRPDPSLTLIRRIADRPRHREALIPQLAGIGHGDGQRNRAGQDNNVGHGHVARRIGDCQGELIRAAHRRQVFHPEFSVAFDHAIEYICISAGVHHLRDDGGARGGGSRGREAFGEFKTLTRMPEAPVSAWPSAALGRALAATLRTA